MSAARLFLHRKILSGKYATVLAVLHAPLPTAARCLTGHQFSWLLQSYKNRAHPNPGNPAQGLVSGVINLKSTSLSLRSMAVGKEKHPHCTSRFTGSFYTEWLLSIISAFPAGN